MTQPFFITRRHLLLGAAASLPFCLQPVSALAATNDKPPLIVLDPGHGGHDPGAVGVTGLFEKHVALAAALDLRDSLQKTGRYRVIVTRDDDVFIPLEKRVAFAESQKASLFVSIHADALSDPHVRGASVYTGSRHASDAEAAEVARVENAADGTDQSSSFGDVSPEVASILESLMSRATRTWSVRLQRDIVKALGTDVNLLKNPARHANFVVLRSPSIPSVLVEMAFMSNRQDEALLQTSAFRKKVVSNLHGSIETCMTDLMAAA